MDKHNEDDKLALLIAETVVIKLAKDWQDKPCYWYSEIDIQAELRSRLAVVFTALGIDEVVWKSSESPETPPGNDPEKIARVQCEPNWGQCIPDLVIWGHKVNGSVPDEECPALWACEIKYVKEDAEEDIGKLLSMLSKGYATNGCSLSFQDGETNEPEPVSHSKNPKLRIVEVKAPRKGC